MNSQLFSSTWGTIRRSVWLRFLLVLFVILLGVRGLDAAGVITPGVIAVAQMLAGVAIFTAALPLSLLIRFDQIALQHPELSAWGLLFFAWVLAGVNYLLVVVCRTILRTFVLDPLSKQAAQEKSKQP